MKSAERRRGGYIDGFQGYCSNQLTYNVYVLVWESNKSEAVIIKES